jgi:hypothetical protein
MTTSSVSAGLIGLPGIEVFQEPVGADVDRRFGIRVNALPISELFDLYERTRFLYPAKREKLAPVMPLVMRNWERLRKAGELLLCNMTVQDRATGATSSITKWRSSLNGTLVQHLVSEGNPLGTRAVSLGATATSYVMGADRFHQNWFRPDNRFPARVFGTLPESAGAERAAVHDLRFWSVSRRRVVAECSAGVVEPVKRLHDRSLLLDLIRRSRGSLWAAIEEIDCDLELDSIDAIYRRIGLSRYRRVWMAVPNGADAPVMAAIAYRGPLGMNFSFLENRCELMIEPGADAELVKQLMPALLGAAAAAYDDFELPYIPVVACDAATESLLVARGEFLRHYSQSVWTREGCPAFYQHINRIYDRFLLRAEGKGRHVAVAC